MNRAAVLSILLVLSALPAAASVQDDLEQLQAQYRDEQVRARRLRADARDAQAEMVALDRELATLRRDQTADDRQLSSQRQRLRDLSAREATIVAELARARDGQGRLLSALQMLSRKPPPPLLIPAGDAVDAVRATILMKAMAPELQRRAAALAARQAEVVRIRRLAVLSSERLLTTESAQGDRRAEIEDLSARRVALLAVLRADATRAERAAAALQRRPLQVARRGALCGALCGALNGARPAPHPCERCQTDIRLLDSLTARANTFINTVQFGRCVAPAQAGVQRLTSNVTGFPPTREQRVGLAEQYCGWRARPGRRSTDR
jgi:hypothetical protein